MILSPTLTPAFSPPNLRPGDPQSFVYKQIGIIRLCLSKPTCSFAAARHSKLPAGIPQSFINGVDGQTETACDRLRVMTAEEQP